MGAHTRIHLQFTSYCPPYIQGTFSFRLGESTRWQCGSWLFQALNSLASVCEPLEYTQGKFRHGEEALCYQHGKAQRRSLCCEMRAKYCMKFCTGDERARGWHRQISLDSCVLSGQSQTQIRRSELSYKDKSRPTCSYIFLRSLRIVTDEQLKSQEYIPCHCR